MALITYDVGNNKQKEVKAGMLALRYLDYLAGDKSKVYLPNTTLWRDGTTPDQAIDDLKKVCNDVKATLERVVAVPEAGWRGLAGVPHAD